MRERKINANNSQWFVVCVWGTRLAEFQPESSCLLVNFAFYFIFYVPFLSFDMFGSHSNVLRTCAWVCVRASMHVHVFARSDDPDFSGIHQLGYLCIQKVTSYLKCK